MRCPDCGQDMFDVDYDPGDQYTPPTPAEWFCELCGIAIPVERDDNAGA